MTSHFLAAIFTFSLAASAASADNHGSRFPVGSETLGRCVLDQFLEAAQNENARLRAIINSTDFLTPHEPYPRNRLEFIHMMRRFIQHCPSERFQAALWTAQTALERESITGSELSYFGAVAEDAVVSILADDFSD